MSRDCHWGTITEISEADLVLQYGFRYGVSTRRSFSEGVVYKKTIPDAYNRGYLGGLNWGGGDRNG